MTSRMLGFGLLVALLDACAPLPSEVGPSDVTGSSSETGEAPTTPYVLESTDGSSVSETTGRIDPEEGTTGDGQLDGSSSGGDDPATTDATGAVPAVEDSGDGSSGGGDPPSCAELYGEATGYIECASFVDECHFASWTYGGTCEQLCESFGGECLGAFDNHHVDGQECISTHTASCDVQRETEICVCSR